MKKVIIADDEAAGRKLIREYLEEFPSFVLIAEANNGVDAVRVINEFKPDLLFLDIQMPGMNGFDVLTHLEEIPKIIFSTAYDKYALKAFEVHAVDYLLKPYTLDRFRHSIEKVKDPAAQASLLPLAGGLIMNQSRYPERILVQAGKKLVNISTAGVVRVEAFGDYSKLHTIGDVFLSNFGISLLEEKLSPDKFIRIHRSSIINIDFIKEVIKYPGSYDVLMQNGDLVTVSRGYMENLKRLMF